MLLRVAPPPGWAALVLSAALLLLSPSARAEGPAGASAFIGELQTLLEHAKTSFAAVRGEKRGDDRGSGAMYQNKHALTGWHVNVLMVEQVSRSETATKAYAIGDFADAASAEAFLREAASQLLQAKVGRVSFRPSAAGHSVVGELSDVVVVSDAARNPVAEFGHSARNRRRVGLVVFGADYLARATAPVEPSERRPAAPASGPERVRAFYAQFVASAEQMLGFLERGRASDFDAGLAALRQLIERRDAIADVAPGDTGLKTALAASYLAVDRISVDTWKTMFDTALRDRVAAEPSAARTIELRLGERVIRVGPAGEALAQRLVKAIERVRGGGAPQAPADAAGTREAPQRPAPPAPAAPSEDRNAKAVLELYVARDAEHRPLVQALLGHLKLSMEMDRSGAFNRSAWPRMSAQLKRASQEVIGSVERYRAAIAALGLASGDNALRDRLAAYLPLAERFAATCAVWGSAISDPALDEDEVKGHFARLEAAARAMAMADRAVLASLDAYKARNGLR